MTVQYKSFYLPVKMYNDDIETELNQFLNSSRINNIHREFVANGDHSFWSVLIEYIINDKSTGKSESSKADKKRIDYREVLSPQDFALFAKIREWRKMEAEKEKIPVYSVFTNEQLSIISTRRITTKNGLQKLDGVGEARVNKYADSVIKIVQSHIDIEKELQKNNNNETTQ